MGEEFVGVADLARRFGLPVSWWYAKAEAEVLPSYRIGKYLRFKPGEIAAWLEQHRRGPVEARKAIRR